VASPSADLGPNCSSTGGGAGAGAGSGIDGVHIMLSFWLNWGDGCGVRDAFGHCSDVRNKLVTPGAAEVLEIEGFASVLPVTFNVAVHDIVGTLAVHVITLGKQQ